MFPDSVYNFVYSLIYSKKGRCGKWVVLGILGLLVLNVGVFFWILFAIYNTGGDIGGKEVREVFDWFGIFFLSLLLGVIYCYRKRGSRKKKEFLRLLSFFLAALFLLVALVIFTSAIMSF